jgi:uncharacterized protein (TIGR00730 family)
MDAAMKSICVFCGGNLGKRPSYLAAARRLGEAFAREGIALVYGGSHVGLMGAIADAVITAGGEAHGVIPEFLASKEIAHLGITKLTVVSSMHERKAAMAAQAEGFVALPGGFGTLDELFEILTWAQLGLHKKPVALLDVEGYFASLLAFLDRAADDGLLRPEHRAMLLVEPDPDRLIAAMRAYRAPAVEKWIRPDQT